MKRRFRLARSVEFKRVRRSGKSYAHPLLVLLTLPNNLDAVRVGFAINHMVGGAVQRNRIKRQLRACLDELIPSLLPGWDMIFLVRRPAGKATFDQLRAGVNRLLNQAALLVKMDVSN